MPALSLEENNAMPDTAPAKRFLFAHWEGGSNTPPMLALVRHLRARGHAVRVLSDLCSRSEVESTGCLLCFMDSSCATTRQVPAVRLN